MRYKNYFRRLFLPILLSLAMAGTAAAQTCPGPAVRTALINLQRAVANPTLYTTTGARAGQVGVTDTCGNQRYTYFPRILDTCLTANPFGPVIGNPVNAFAYICGTDSLFYFDWTRTPVFVGAGGSAADSLNWYNSNDTTTNLLRTAFLLRSAWWRGLDSTGFARLGIRPDNFDGSQFSVYQDSVVVDADTLIWASSWHPELQVHELQAEGTYFYADSLQVVGIGQFPAFPSFNFDGSEKGFFYDVQGEGVILTNGLPANNIYNSLTLLNNSFRLESVSNGGVSTSDITGQASGQICTMDLRSFIFSSGNGSSITIETDDANNEDYTEMVSRQNGSRVQAGALLGYKDLHEPRQFEVYSVADPVFSWLAIYLPDDTVGNQVSFYNHAYDWKNAHPIGAPGDTLFHFWAATGPGGEAGKDPGFMTLDQICDHCADNVVNIYNSDGTTTDNTRIATITETITFLSDDVTIDGVFPFRFELAGESPNEPEMMVWKFPSDSATLYQSDQELTLFSSNHWLLKSNGYSAVQADSFFYNPNLGGTAWKVGQYNVVTQNSASSGSHADYLANRTITGTAQTELFLDGSSAVLTVPANSNSNFRVHFSAICSSAGNGVGISTGDSWDSWVVGGIKRISNTTTLVGSVQTLATAQADTGMSTSVPTVDANDANDSLRIRFTPPSTAGSTTVIKVVASIDLTQTTY